MDLEDFLPYIVHSDIPEAYRPMAALIGTDAFLKLCRLCGGTAMYLPMADSVIRKARNRLVLGEYNGYNARELSRKYGVTERHIRNIAKGRESPDKGQGKEKYPG